MKIQFIVLFSLKVYTLNLEFKIALKLKDFV